MLTHLGDDSLSGDEGQGQISDHDGDKYFLRAVWVAGNNGLFFGRSKAEHQLEVAAAKTPTAVELARLANWTLKHMPLGNSIATAPESELSSDGHFYPAIALPLKTYLAASFAPAQPIEEFIVIAAINLPCLLRILQTPI